MSLTSYRAAPPRVPGRRLYLNKFYLRKRKLCVVRNLRGLLRRQSARGNISVPIAEGLSNVIRTLGFAGFW